VKVSNGETVQEFTVALCIREMKGSGIVAFKFNRLQGDPIAFGRIWIAAEECLLKSSGSIFFDDLDECLKPAFEIKED